MDSAPRHSARSDKDVWKWTTQDVYIKEACKSNRTELQRYAMGRIGRIIGAVSITLIIVGYPPATLTGDLAPVQSPVNHVLEVTTRERWMHAAQRSEFTPFSPMSFALQVDGTTPDSLTGERTLRLSRLDRRTGEATTLVVGRDGAIVRQETQLGAPIPTPPGMSPAEAVRFAQNRLFDEERLVLPATRAWDALPRVHPVRFTPGQRWTDTVALASEVDGSRQALDGVRTSVLVRDTVVDGRSLWIVRDNARVRYTERAVDFERALDTTVAVERTATGSITGQYLYDRLLGMHWSRVDTTALSGEAILRYPDGRSFHTSARYERTREMTLREPAAYVARRDQIRLERMRTSTGSVVSPANETETRLWRGDTMVRDSLLRAWDRENDPNRREQIYRTLMLWARPEGFRAELERHRAAAGDSAFAIKRLWSLAYPAQSRIDRALALEMIRVMQDPGISFAANLYRDPIYENLAQTFTTWPRALEPDTARWKCTVEACALFEQQFRTAQEPRLRDVGLTALVTGDPVRWADSLAGQPRARSTVLRRVTELANGRLETYPSRTPVPLPAPDADWRAWRDWTSGNFAVPIQFYGQRANRDLRTEIRTRYASAPNDSARLVFGTLLASFGEFQSATEVAERLRSGSRAEQQLAISALPALFGARAPFADSATTVAVIDRVLADAVSRPGSDSLYVLSDSIPTVLRARWSNRLRFVSRGEWQAISERQAARLLTVSRVERVGSLVRVSSHAAGRLGRQPNESVQLYYSWATYYMVETNGTWSTVSVIRAIT